MSQSTVGGALWLSENSADRLKMCVSLEGGRDDHLVGGGGDRDVITFNEGFADDGVVGGEGGRRHYRVQSTDHNCYG
ncbi:hypothetical protein [Phaeovulum sp.]|uniref:hypothetical protein n=1 Tax=Phaeovulum sp. TaxID=2934796 RepID=UPI0039E34388